MTSKTLIESLKEKVRNKYENAMRDAIIKHEQIKNAQLGTSIIDVAELSYKMSEVQGQAEAYLDILTLIKTLEEKNDK